jgi:hypothetical protein
LKIDEICNYQIFQKKTLGNSQWVWISPGNCSLDNGVHIVSLITYDNTSPLNTTTWGGADIVLITNNRSFTPKDGEIPP